MDFPYENKSGGNFFPPSSFLSARWGSHIKISENGNFQTAVKIVWQVVLTQNFAFRQKFRCRIRIWHPFYFRFNGFHKPRSDVENRLRESDSIQRKFHWIGIAFTNIWIAFLSCSYVAGYDSGYPYKLYADRPCIYWWFECGVIKNMILQIMIDLSQILVWSIRPQNVSLYQIWSHLDQRKQSYKQKKLENFLLCYIGKWAGGVLLPTNIAATI